MMHSSIPWWHRRTVACMCAERRPRMHATCNLSTFMLRNIAGHICNCDADVLPIRPPWRPCSCFLHACGLVCLEHLAWVLQSKSRKSMRAFMLFFIFSCSFSARCACLMSRTDTCTPSFAQPSIAEAHTY